MNRLLFTPGWQRQLQSGRAKQKWMSAAVWPVCVTFSLLLWNDGWRVGEGLADLTVCSRVGCWDTHTHAADQITVMTTAHAGIHINSVIYAGAQQTIDQIADNRVYMLRKHTPKHSKETKRMRPGDQNSKLSTGVLSLSSPPHPLPPSSVPWTHTHAYKQAHIRSAVTWTDRPAYCWTPV